MKCSLPYCSNKAILTFNVWQVCPECYSRLIRLKIRRELEAENEISLSKM